MKAAGNERVLFEAHIYSVTLGEKCGEMPANRGPGDRHTDNRASRHFPGTMPAVPARHSLACRRLDA